MKHNLLLLALSLTGFISTQTQASQLAITTNLSNARITGSVDDYLTGEHDSYTDGSVYSSSVIPLQVSQVFYDKDAFIPTATASSQAELSVDIVQTGDGYSILGAVSSTANTEINSLDDNDAIANGEAVVDLAFTLASDHNFTFTSSMFNASGTGKSEVELINKSTGTIFSQIVSENALDLNFSGNLLAGDYTLFIGALSEASDADFASASVGYDLQITAVPVPTALPLFLSGLITLGFKSRSKHKALT
ncbi:MAG: hypothetical protein V3V18_06650 [Methylococcales bacterium]